MEIKMTDMYLNPLCLVVFGLLLSFAIVFVSIPTIVSVANLKKLYDEPGRRKSHKQSIPNLGGIAIFGGFVISTGIFVDISLSRELFYLFIGLVILFFVGVKDDILIIAPAKKLYGEILACIVIIIIGDMRFTNLHGFLGIAEVSYIPSIILSIFVMIVIINSFNLIDGIDGLASGIGMVVSSTFGIWFYLTGQTNYAIMAATLLGSLICFFGYNVFGTKNKIFMGDTGSLIVGLVISTIIIKFNEFNVAYTGPYRINSAPAVSFGILIIPLFDTARVFLIRILRGRSPFDADKNHLHHRMLKLGFSHISATLVLLTLNIIFVFLAFFFQSIGIIYLMILNISVAIAFTAITEYFIRKNKHHEIYQSNSRHHVRA
jgi:UDP-N-acetylmuramyl pentapeptide phosphotransferase/UDP-N-acetylglucosamine-1-phosphate transferase